ncbi:DUF2255 family protein [Nocardia sp. CA2R105]|uniref:DUF2255 family protein n=1 Tax=Nocardia coffeae TaxID=2873381 RepID=UPI001CA6B9AF|nr:DUF2255 family protein [Nocardia coffeae]MBY8862907.1 DUF2255 family protein [Nocardia coffeae]
MTETRWTTGDLDHWGGTEEIRISTRRSDGTLRAFVPIWIVAAGGNLYVRSYRGTDGAWYRHALEQPDGRIRTDGIDRDVHFVQPSPSVRAAIDTAYRTKYPRYGDRYLRPMLADAAVTATLQLDPQPETLSLPTD